MKSDHYIVDIQGFKDAQNKFIIKELAVATEEFTLVFSIKPPFPYSRLSNEERRHVSWIEKTFGFRWSEGHIDFREFKRIIVPYLENKNIFVKGQEKIKWVQELCDTCNIFDIGQKGCPNFLVLYNMFLKGVNKITLNHVIDKHCSLRNVICIKKWFYQNQELFNK